MILIKWQVWKQIKGINDFDTSNTIFMNEMFQLCSELGEKFNEVEKEKKMKHQIHLIKKIWMKKVWKKVILLIMTTDKRVIVELNIIQHIVMVVVALVGKMYIVEVIIVIIVIIIIV